MKPIAVLMSLCAATLLHAPLAAADGAHMGADPLIALVQANADARRSPDLLHLHQGVQIYDFAPGAIYEVYATPGFVSTVMLEPNEAIITVAAGDTARWMLEETHGGDSAIERPILLLKPTRARLRTNIVIVTDRRTYAIEAVSATGQTYSSQTAWRYPPDPHASNIEPAHTPGFNFFYRIETVRGVPPRWAPVRAFDDGAKTYIEFPAAIAVSEAPPLFITESGEPALVNYRVLGNRYIVDRLFDRAELRLGSDHPTIVRISRAVAIAPRARRHGRHP